MIHFSHIFFAFLQQNSQIKLLRCPSAFYLLMLQYLYRYTIYIYMYISIYIILYVYALRYKRKM